MRVVDIDEGCGVIQKGQQTKITSPSLEFSQLTFDFLAANRRDVMNLVSVDQFVKSPRSQSV